VKEAEKEAEARKLLEDRGADNVSVVAQSTSLAFLVTNEGLASFEAFPTE
jgi:hypothetical protein